MTPTPNGTGNPSAIEWPVVAIGPMHLTLKWSFRALFQASKTGIDLKKLSGGNPENMATYMEVFALMVGWTFTAMGQPMPTAEFWADKISELPEPLEKVKEIALAVQAAFAKAPLVKQTAPATPAIPIQPENSAPTEASEKTEKPN